MHAEQQYTVNIWKRNLTGKEGLGVYFWPQEPSKSNSSSSECQPLQNKTHQSALLFALAQTHGLWLRCSVQDFSSA